METFSELVTTGKQQPACSGSAVFLGICRTVLNVWAVHQQAAEPGGKQRSAAPPGLHFSVCLQPAAAHCAPLCCLHVSLFTSLSPSVFQQREGGRTSSETHCRQQIRFKHLGYIVRNKLVPHSLGIIGFLSNNHLRNPAKTSVADWIKKNQLSAAVLWTGILTKFEGWRQILPKQDFLDRPDFWEVWCCLYEDKKKICFPNLLQ